MNEALVDYLKLGCVPSEEVFLPQEQRIIKGVSLKSAWLASGGAFGSFGVTWCVLHYMMDTPLGETLPTFLGASYMFIGLVFGTVAAIKWKGYTETEGKDTINPSYISQLYKNLSVYPTPLLLKMAQHSIYNPETVEDIKNYLSNERQLDGIDNIIMIEQSKTLFELVTEPPSPLKAMTS